MMHPSLAQCKLFLDIPQDALPELLTRLQASIITYEKDALIFTQMDQPRASFVLLEGSVAVCNDSSLGTRSVMARFDRPGELFGEVFVFLGREQYENYAQALTAAKVLRIPRETFIQAQSDDMEAFRVKLSANMLTILAQKNVLLNQRMQIISCTTLRQKIAKLLLLRAAPDGSVALHMSREELADYLATTRPSLSRELMRMQAEGLLEANKRGFYLLSREKLEELL